MKSEPIEETLEIQGSIARILFYSSERGYFIGRFDGDGTPNFTACGPMREEPQPGSFFRLTGCWVNHERYGKQFQFTRYEQGEASTTRAIERYLASGIISGITPTLAKRLVAWGGEKTLQLLTQDPSIICASFHGLAVDKLKKIQKSLAKNLDLQEVIIPLQKLGLNIAQCLQIQDTYQTEALTITRENPYQLAIDIPGIGFKTADMVAKRLGWSLDSSERISCGLIYCLQELESEGHSCVPLNFFLNRAQQTLEIDLKKLELGYDKLLQQKELCQFSQDQLIFIQRTPFYQRERQIEMHLGRIQCAHEATLLRENENTLLAWAQSQEGFRFADRQIEALHHALNEPISILTGGPGTGKTTILRALTRILRRLSRRVTLAAPTGRAAQKMTEATELQASTIHRLLCLSIDSRRKQQENEPLKSDYIIIDEVSMLDEFLAKAILQAIPSGAQVLFLGDKDQLASIGAGNFLADLIDSQRFRVTRLDQIFRQNDGSNIPSIAQSILQNAPILPPKINDYRNCDFSQDVGFIETTSPEDCRRVVVDLTARILPQRLSIDPFDEIQVLAPMHKGIAGIQALNEELQQALIYQKKIEPNQKFVAGDKVIQLKNNYEKRIFNGDLGRIFRIDSKSKKMSVLFDKEIVELDPQDQQKITHAYVISIHKAQGSDFPIVILPLISQYSIMLQRKLLYTALTRSRQKVFIVGEREAFFTAALATQNINRWTNLLRS